MSAVVPVKSRAAEPSRKGEFGVEEAEAVIAALADKVARLQKDIGALKRADDASAASQRETRMPPTKMTCEKKVARFAKGTRGGDEDRCKGESRSRSHEPAADSREAALSRRAATTATTTTTTTRQRKHALFNAPRKNRPQPQEVNCRADDDDDAQRYTRHPNASDFTPTPESQGTCTRKVLRKRISRGIQYDMQDCQVANYHISMKCFRAKSPEIKEASTKHRQDHRPETSADPKARRDDAELGARSIDGPQRDASAIRNTDERAGTDAHQPRRGTDGGRGARRCAVGDEGNRPPVAEAVTTPHRRPDLDEPSAADERLDRAADSGGPAPAATRSADGKSVKGRRHAAASQKKSDAAKERAKKTVLSADEKANEQEAGADAPKAQPSTGKKKAEDSKMKVGEKDQVSKARTATSSEISSKIMKFSKATVKKIKPDKKNKHTVLKEAPDERERKSSKIDSMKSNKFMSRKNGNHESRKQKTKNNSKSSDSIEPKHIALKDKLSNCTKEINQLLGKVSGLFRRKNSKSK